MQLSSILIYIKSFLFEIYLLAPNLLSANNLHSGNSLQQIELLVTSEVSTYINYRQHYLDQLKDIILTINQENLKPHKEDEKYFENPINVFRFTQRLAIAWGKIENFLDNDEEKFKKLKSLRIVLGFPNMTILVATIVNFFWIQDTYNLKSSSLVKGLINGIQYNTSMRFGDCFLLGYAALFDDDYYHSIIWFNESLNNFDSTWNIAKEVILQYLSKSYYAIGDIVTAKRFSEQTLKVSSDEDYIKFNQMLHDEKIIPNEPQITLNKFPQHLYPSNFGIFTFPILCYSKKNKQLADLRCLYVNNNIPFLFIAPVKKEILNHDPLIVIFHDIINDNEIETLIERAKPKLSESEVLDEETKKILLSRNRVSKMWWLDEFALIKKIKKRVADFTTLSLNLSENLISYYQIGGHFSQHYDFLENDVEHQRIATLLVYLNDVEQGGATILSKLNITVWPKKGSALFWHNLHSSGENDLRTEHAGCPVLVGSNVHNLVQRDISEHTSMCSIFMAKNELIDLTNVFSRKTSILHNKKQK